MKRLKIILIAFTIASIVGCTNTSEKLPSHEVKLIKISNEVSLEVLDWGGNGTPMLFLAGLGNSAHVFDEFAPKFTDKFHVYALTRRGFGASSQPKEGYDVKTLTEDIISVMDKLHLKKVILVGHSIAGEEMTKIGNDYPDRIEKIIYLDAAYDRTDMAKLFALMPEFPKPQATDSTSIETMKKYIERVNGVSFSKEELQQGMVFSKEGKYLKDVTPEAIGGAIIGSVIKPEYATITCPSLAIYAKQEGIKDVLPFYETLDSINKNKADQLIIVWRKLEIEAPIRFLRESKNGIVKKIKGHHYIFLSNSDETEKAMRNFLE